MAISSLGTTARTIIATTLTNGGLHSFFTGSLSGFLYVRSTAVVTVVLGRASASAATLAGQSGTDFSVGADNFDTLLIYGDIGDEIVIDFIPVTTSTATTAPSWLALAGYSFTSNTYISQPTKILWPVDTVTVGNALPSGRLYAAGCSDSGVAGYMFGGYVASTTAASSSIDRYTFPTDTAATIAQTMVATRYYHSAYSNSANHAYVTQGYYNGTYNNVGGGNQAIRDKFAFPTMTRTTSSVSLGYAASANCADGHDSGYMIGGGINFSTASSTNVIQRHYFATDVQVNTSNYPTFTADLNVWMAAASHNGDKAVYTVGSNSISNTWPSTTTSTWSATTGSFPLFWTYATSTGGNYAARFARANATIWGGHTGGTIQAHSGTASYFCGGLQTNSASSAQWIEKCAVASGTTSISTLANGIAAPSGQLNNNQAFDNNGVY